MLDLKQNVQFWLLLLMSLRSNDRILAQGVDDRISERQFRTLVVDGVPAEPKEFPHSARLGNRNGDNITTWFCGGTLISNRLVLTAAHCLYSESGEINVVRLGELDFDSDSDNAQPEDFDVHSRKEHPDYQYELLYHDIAIVRLKRTVHFNDYKLPACLPNTGSIRNQLLTAIGWGHTTFAGQDSSWLLKVHLKDFGNRCLTGTDIDELPMGFNDSSQLCIGSTERKDTCNGDSGGPVLIDHVEPRCRHRVIGITSSGIGCGTPKVPSIYTRVHFYVNWIRREINKSKPKPKPKRNKRECRNKLVRYPSPNSQNPL